VGCDGQAPKVRESRRRGGWVWDGVTERKMARFRYILSAIVAHCSRPNLKLY